MTFRVLLALVLPLLAGSASVSQTDCSDVSTNATLNGVYTIYPAGDTPVQAYCDVGCDGQVEYKKWTVIQRRMDGSVNFYRPWEQYKKGFGNLNGEFWLGLETLYQLTSKKKYELRVDLQDFAGAKAYALYSSFSVESEASGYKLNVAGFYNGGAGDSLAHHNGQKFSTFDKDQDSNSDNCAKVYLGAFWYNRCHDANPNGIYVWGQLDKHDGIGNVWNHFKGIKYGLKFISMKIRPVA